ncbi:pulmonary surfactant-associated D, partial [Paramuricea clavata]
PRYQHTNFHTVAGRSATYLNWAAGQPNDVGGSQDCVYMYTSNDKLGKWNDEGCVWPHHYICESKYHRCN